MLDQISSINQEQQLRHKLNMVFFLSIQKVFQKAADSKKKEERKDGEEDEEAG